MSSRQHQSDDRGAGAVFRRIKSRTVIMLGMLRARGSMAQAGAGIPEPGIGDKARYGQMGPLLNRADDRGTKGETIWEPASGRSWKRPDPPKKQPTQGWMTWVGASVVVLVVAALLYGGGGIDDRVVSSMTGNTSAAITTSEPAAAPDVYTIPPPIRTAAPTEYIAPTPAHVTQPPVATSFQMLKQGMEGETVKEMQQRLIELGFLGEGKADGDFGKGTLEAVKAFQKANGLIVDGMAGSATISVLYSEDAAAAAP